MYKSWKVEAIKMGNVQYHNEVERVWYVCACAQTLNFVADGILVSIGTGLDDPEDLSQVIFRTMN